MSRRILLACLLLISAPAALAQQAAEQFIPIGQSPGLSGRVTLLGTIRSADPATGQVRIDLDRGGSRVIRVEAETRLWMDLSQRRESNRRARMADLQPGRRVEAMPHAGSPDHAEWLKVELPSGAIAD